MISRLKHCLVYCMALAILVAYSFSPSALIAYAVEGEEGETILVEQVEEVTQSAEGSEVVPEADKGEKSEPTEVTDAQTEKAGPSEEVEVIEKDTVSALAEVTSIEENASEEALIVLKAIIPEDGSSGHQYGKDIEVVTLDKTDLDQNFTGTVQEALYNAKSENNITRIIIPDGEYQPSGRALEIYSNTILDLRGRGAETPYDTSDDYDNVIIYQSTIDNDPPSLRCGEGDNNQSEGYDSYQNMTVLGGTFIGKRKDGSQQESATAGNIRFGHASNINIIGTKIKDNFGGHHLEIGACNKVLVADCIFSGAKHGGVSGNSKGNSLEAIQLDVSHRENNNFAYYGESDDLPTKNATITNCTFSNVKRGLGTHHAVFRHPYENITVTDNTFTDIADCAMFFVYTKNAKIENNTINSSYRGISFMYLSPLQQFQPNKETAYSYNDAKNFTSSSIIRNNHIQLDPRKTVDSNIDLSQNPVKSGIFIAGENVTADDATKNYNEEIKYNDNYSKHKIPTGVHYILGVTVEDNTIDVVDNSGTKYYRAGILTEYAASCNFNGNDVDLKGYNTDETVGHAGILISKSPNVGLSGNTVKGVTRGATTDGILITECGGTKNVLVTRNEVTGAPRWGINCYKVTNKTLSVWKNTIENAGVSGIKVTDSKMNNVTTNTIKITGTKKMTQPGISITGSTANEVSYNNISGTADTGLLVSKGDSVISTVQKANSNTITSPGKHGIIAYKGSKITYANSNKIYTAKQFGILASTKGYIYQAKSNMITKPGATGIAATGGSTIKYITSNTVDYPIKHGIMIYDKGSYSESIYKNTVSGAKLHGILVDNAATVYLIQENKLTNCTKNGITNMTKVNAIVLNNISKCANNNKPYVKKGMSMARYKVSVAKGKTYKMLWFKAYATKSVPTWSTSNKKIATVTSKGVVKGVGKGTCWIYAKRDKVTVKAKVTVK